MINVLRGQQALQSALQQQSNVEQPDAAITLQRTSGGNINTAGANVTWEQVIRGQRFSFTPPAQQVIIPANGYYAISTTATISAAVNDVLFRLSVNGVIVAQDAAIGDVDRTSFSGQFVRYFVSGDAVRINMLPSATITLVTVNEGAGLESVFVNIVQLTRGVI